MKRVVNRSVVCWLFMCIIALQMMAQNQKIVMNVNDKPVREVLSMLKAKGDVHFTYEEKNIPNQLKVSLNYPQPTDLSTILTDLCHQVQLSYSYKDNIVMLSPLQNQLYTIQIRLLEKGNSNNPLPMATCQLTPLGAYTTTDMAGNTTFKNIPSGQYQLDITYVGFEPIHRIVTVKQDLNLTIRMEPTSLALNEVVVVAKQNVAGQSTSSVIGRQAIEHLQAMSLDDIMQLIPGHLMKNTDLTSKSNLQLRTLVNNSTNAFGASVIMDGVPMSNNGVATQGNYSSTSNIGTDLRQISADDIESVEVIRGIPSAEYGDLTSGLVIVHSKIGQTSWQARAKINPGTMNYSLGKGFRLGNKAGIMNISIDYAKAWGDPRKKTKSFDRYNFSLGYSKDLTSNWHTETKLRYMSGKDWDGNDPDAVDDGTFTQTINRNYNFSHNGKISINKKFARTLSYTFGLGISQDDMRKTSIVSNTSGLLPMLTAMETGYFTIPFATSSYKANGGSESKPGNIFAKIGNSFYLRSGEIHQSFKVGLEYRYDWNNARGYYNEDEQLPLTPNSNGRPRPFYDIPGIHQFAAYTEDNFHWDITKQIRMKVQLGARFTAMQPWNEVKTFALSPRLNASLSLSKWMTLRGGFGMNSKTPGLAYLYPDKKYDDRIAANYLPQNDPAAQLLLYHTQVYDVQFTKGLKNATSMKYELGFDINLPHQRKLSVIAYRDATKNGFGPLTEYFTYTANFYSPQKGLIINPGQATQVDWNNPERSDLVFQTTGKIGNTNVSINKGIELDFDLGEIKPLHTSFYLTGAYQQSETYSTDMNSRNPSSLPVSYAQSNTTPFKIVYPSGLTTSTYRQFSNNLRMVTNIPALRMVASFSAQAIWYNYQFDNNPAMNPIGWIDTDLTYHPITAEMLANDSYTIKDIPLKEQRISPKDNLPSKAPITWLLSGRLTKELGKLGGLSFYANNMIFYEPYLRNSLSNTLTQRNTGNFSFGVELFVNL